MFTQEQYAQLSAEDKDDLLVALRSAIFHLALCWDALRDAENIVEAEIETDDIESITGNMDIPPDNAFKLTLEEIIEWAEVD